MLQRKPCHIQHFQTMTCCNVCWLFLYRRCPTIHSKWCIGVTIRKLAETSALTLINSHASLLKCLAHSSYNWLLAASNTTTRQAPSLMAKPTANQQHFITFVYDQRTHATLAFHIH